MALEPGAVAEMSAARPDLKRIMRTGTVASTDNRNWELLPDATTPAPATPLQPEPRRGAGHGKRHHRRQRLSLSACPRHLPCVSDKPPHGEIKLPGMANHFYRERGRPALRIGIRAMELLRQVDGPAAQPQAAAFAEVAFSVE